MAEKNTASIGFEKQIWDAACVLRGNLDASEYKSVVLGLIFLKYISDRFEDKYNELVAEGDGFEEDMDEYISEGIFFVPESARWNVIASNAHTEEIGTIIDDAMRAIEKENKRLKDILPKNFARPELDKRRLGDVVDLFTNIQMIEHGNEKDILGRTYEYCLSMFAEQEGKRGGEFFTPSCVVRTLVEVLKPFQGRVYEKGVIYLMKLKKAEIQDLNLIVKMKMDMFTEVGSIVLLQDNAEEKIYAKYKKLYQEEELCHYLVYEDDNVIACGGAIIKEDVPFCFFKTPMYGYIMDVYCVPEKRRNGYASEIMERLISWLQDKEIHNIKLKPSATGREMYEKFGFGDSGEMELWL